MILKTLLNENGSVTCSTTLALIFRTGWPSIMSKLTGLVCWMDSKLKLGCLTLAPVCVRIM
jgi:hypothetical protein